MVLDSKTIDKIKSFVYQKPRTINEIADFLNRNWRTADRYVKEIAETSGEIGIRTFRKGTRGALKIAFWNNIENIYSTATQDKIFEYIEQGLEENEFSPFDIFQYIDEEKRKAEVSKREHYDWIKRLLQHAKEEVLVFSGNLSWVNSPGIIPTIEACVERGVLIKVLGRVEYVGFENTIRLHAINSRLKKDNIEVRHDRHPLRAFIIDDGQVRFRELIFPSYYEHELSEKMIFYYDIYDKDWISWLRKVFWKKYQQSIPAGKRLQDLQSISKKQQMLFKKYP